MLIESHKTHTFALAVKTKKEMASDAGPRCNRMIPFWRSCHANFCSGFPYFLSLPVDNIMPHFRLWSMSILSASSLPVLFNVVYHNCPFQYCVVFQHKAPFRLDNVDGDVQELGVFVTHLAVTVLSALSFCFPSVIVPNSPTSNICVFLYISLPQPTCLEGSHNLSVHFPLFTESLSQVWQTLIAWSDNLLYSRIKYVSLLSLKNFLWMKEGALCMADSESWLMRMLLITEPLITY